MGKGFVFFSDTHLDLFTYPSMEEMKDDTFVAFKHCIDLAIKLGVSVVNAGDIVECNPRDYPYPVTIDFLSSQLRRLEQHGLKFYYINGQHDRPRHQCSWPSAVNPEVAIPIHLQRVIVGGVPIVGLDSVFYHELDPYLFACSEIAKPGDLLIAHQRWSQFLKYEGASDGNLSQVPDVFSGVITGDLHSVRRMKIRRKEKGKVKSELIVTSPGATVRRASGEPDEHYVWHTPDGIKMKKFLLPSRPVLRIRVEDVHDVDREADSLRANTKRLTQLPNDLPPEISRPIVYVSGPATLDLLTAVAEMYQDFCHVRVGGGTAGRVKELPESFGAVSERRVDVADYIDKVSDDEDVRELVRHGLKSQDCRVFLKKWRARRGVIDAN